MSPLGDTEHPPIRQLLRGRRGMLLACGGVVLVAVYLCGLLPRLALWRRLEHDAQTVADTLPSVQTTQPQLAPVVVDVPLPGTTQPILTTGIYARTNGYLKTRYVDVGDHVTTGQLLAIIAAPEVDQELSQAKAMLVEMQANVVKLQADLDLARTTLRRYVAAGVGSVSQQQIDVNTASVVVAEKAVDAAQATVAANQSNVDRLLELQGFEKVFAPFDGVITQRHVDFGSLITAGSTVGTTELFNLSQLDPLRIFVYVPQEYSADVHDGQEADVTVRQLPKRVFHGSVSRTAGALDPTSRTLLTEVLVPNRDGALLSGAYVTIRFKIQRSTPPLLIPGTALLVDAQGIRAAIVEPDGTLHYRAIEIGRDYGAQIEVLDGLSPSDAVAVRWPGALADGSRVKSVAVDAHLSATEAPATTPGAAAPNAVAHEGRDGS